MDLFQHLAVALEHQDAGRFEEARDVYLQILAGVPDQPDVLQMFGVLSYQTGRLQEAADAFRRAIAAGARQEVLYSFLGSVLEELGQLSEAGASYEEARRLDPDAARPIQRLGVVRMREGRLDEAEALIREALQKAPGAGELHNDLGIVLEKLRRPDEAEASYREALRLGLDTAEARANLAHLLRKQRRTEEALALYRQALALQPQDLELQYHVAVLSGEGLPTVTPPALVTRAFDDYSAAYDQHMVVRLSFRIPQQIGEAVRQVSDRTDLDILDLGCGTGLSGLEFQERAKTLVGIDLSPKMLARAQERGIYTRLILGDLNLALQEPGVSYDLVLASDLLVYLGDLASLFESVTRVLRPGGLFAFSVEAHEGSGFVLRNSGRFAHSKEYLRKLADACGLSESGTYEAVLRTRNDQPVAGYIVVLERG